MKIHDEIEDWMAGALCGALSPDEKQNFERHLADCPRCRSLYEEDQKMNDILNQTLPELRPDPNFERRVIAAFRERIAGGGFHPWRGLVWFVQFRSVQAALAILILAAMVRGGSMITGEKFRTNNPIIARVAFWNDNESNKIALNTTGEGLSGESANNPVAAEDLRRKGVDLLSAPTVTTNSGQQVPVQYTAQVFSGQATWNTGSNWGDTKAESLRREGSPGLSGQLAAGDTATFDKTRTLQLGNATALGANTTTDSLNFTGTDGRDEAYREYDYYPGHPAAATASPVLAQLILSGRNNIVGGNGNLGINATGKDGISLNGGSVTNSSSLAASNTDGFTKLGSGAETFAGVNSYTGKTRVNGGNLAVNGSLGVDANGITVTGGNPSGTFNGSFADGRTLSRNGVIAGAVAGSHGLAATNTGGLTFSGGTLQYSTAASKNPEPSYNIASGAILSTQMTPGGSGYTPTTPESSELVEFDRKTGKRYPTEFNPPAVPNSVMEKSRNFTFTTGTGNIGNVAYSGGDTKFQTLLAQTSSHRDAPGAAQGQGAPLATPAPVDARKLIRNASLDFEVASFEKALDTITSVAGEEQGYVFSQNSAKGANGKLQGQIIVKVLPGNLDRFLLKLRLLGDMKNQTVSAQDVSKDYYDTEVRIRNSQVTEARLIEMMKTRTGKVSDLLEVENEISRVRGEIEQMQGQLKVYDAQVQYATVLIGLQEKDLNQTAAYLLQEHAQLSLFAKDVEKAFAEAKGDAEAAKAQTLDSHMERDEAGHVVATLHLLIPPDASDEAIIKLKSIGRIEHYNSQTQSVARNGSDNSDTAKVDRDKVELNLVIQRDAENAVQGTNISVLTDKVEEKSAEIKDAAAKAGIEVKGAEFNRMQNGVEISGMLLRMPVRKYAAFIEQIKALGKVKDFTVARREDATATEDAPAEILLQIYSQGYIVAPDTGLWATVRGTIGEGFSALMWSLRMIGVSLAFIIPWAVGLGIVIWLVVRRRRKARKQS